jgi:O-antigen/teichoic acid export membrane protein
VAAFLTRAFPAGGFLRNAAGLAGASVAAQAIGLLAAPLITRLYAPAELGALALFTAAAGLLGIVAGGRWHLAFAAAPKPDRAALMALTMLVAVVGAGVLTVLVFPLGPWLAVEVGTARAFWAWLAPLGGALAAINLAARWLAVAEGRNAAAGRAMVLRPAVAALAQIGAGAFGADELGLILGALAGWLAADTALLLGQPLLATRAALSGVLLQYRAYPAQALPAALASHAVVVLPEFYIAAHHGATSLGYYAVVVRLLAAPVIAFSEAVSALWWRRAARQATPGPAMLRLFDRLLLGLGIPAALGAAVVMVAGPDIFALVLGEAWRTAGAMARYLAVYHALRLVSAPVLQTGAALGKLTPATLWNATDLALAVFACGAGLLLDMSLANWLMLFGGLGAASRAGAIVLMRQQAAGRL